MFNVNMESICFERTIFALNNLHIFTWDCELDFFGKTYISITRIPPYPPPHPPPYPPLYPPLPCPPSPCPPSLYPPPLTGHKYHVVKVFIFLNFLSRCYTERFGTRTRGSQTIKFRLSSFALRIVVKNRPV